MGGRCRSVYRRSSSCRPPWSHKLGGKVGVAAQALQQARRMHDALRQVGVPVGCLLGAADNTAEYQMKSTLSQMQQPCKDEARWSTIMPCLHNGQGNLRTARMPAAWSHSLEQAAAYLKAQYDVAMHCMSTGMTACWQSWIPGWCTRGAALEASCRPLLLTSSVSIGCALSSALCLLLRDTSCIESPSALVPVNACAGHDVCSDY